VRAIASAFATPVGDEAKLRLEQYLLVCRSMGPSAFAMPAFCFILCFIYAQWISTPWLIAWWLCVTIASLAHWFADLKQKQATVDTTTFSFWMNVRAVLTFTHNLAWTFPAYIFWPYCSEFGQLLFILIYACTMSGGVALAAPCPRWLIPQMTPIAAAIIIAPMTSGTWAFFGIGLLSIGYVAFMGHLAFQLYGSARAALLLREENAGLVKQLSTAKEESDRARARAEAANRAKSDFLANMSHELRTPLNAVLGFSEMIQTRVWGDQAIDRYAEYAESINASGKHLLRLINDVLDLAKIEAGRFELREDRVDLIAVARQALRLLETQAKQKGVRALLDASTDVSLHADERALLQVMTNLLSNAVKFTPSGGAITVFIERKQGEGVLLVVRDSGVGIRPEDMSRVLESFGQGRHDVTTTDERGTGLGLPIVKGLVDAHGGQLRIESKVGVGTAVIVALPESRIMGPLDRALHKIA
jgi:two-component system cell cycle sensor histidine kinase PleC